MLSLTRVAELLRPRWFGRREDPPSEVACCRVIVVGRSIDAPVPDDVLDAGEYEMMFIESIAGAFTQIVEARPDRVIVCLGLDDIAGFQLVSMLKLDPRTKTIPLLTYIDNLLDASGNR